MIHRRDVLRSALGAAGTLVFGSPTPASSRTVFNSRGVVHVIVFSNFEGQPIDARPVIRWFDDCARVHPAVRWTHMYNPRYFVVKSPEYAAAERMLTPHLLKLETEGTAEIGLHLHMYYDMVRAMGVTPRAYPFAGDTADSCNTARSIDEDRSGGYDVLLTAYTLDEQSIILDSAMEAFRKRGFRQPRAFCAGYSATTPETQSLLASKGFAVSFAAQTISPQLYGSCWEKLLAWSRNITPLTIPYRVSRHSILPPPHASDEYLDLVEVPLNLGVDTHDLYLDDRRVTRVEMFDRHYEWARRTKCETAVAIGVHAEVIAAESWDNGPVAGVLDELLRHAAHRAESPDVEIRYGMVSTVAERFRANQTLGTLSQQEAHC